MSELETYLARKPEDRITVRAICIHENKLLVVKRVRLDEQYMVLPGGGIDSGEKENEAVEREVFEETGVVIRAVEKVLTIPPYDRFSEQNVWRCEYVSGEPHLDPDGEEAKRSKPGINTYEPCWVPLEEAIPVVLPRKVVEEGLLGQQ